MADPLSISAGVAGFISLSLDVASRLNKFYRSYQNHNDTIAEAANRMDLLAMTLESVQQHLTHRKFCNGEEQLIRTIECHIDNCEVPMDDLRERLSKFEKFAGKSAGGVWAKTITNARRFAYPFEEHTIQKLFADVDKVKLNITMASQLLQNSDTEDIHDHLLEVKQIVNSIRHEGFSATIHHWLNPPDSTIQYNETCRKKLPGTGSWLVRRQVFTAWLVSRNSLLYVNGFPGTGKSFICCTAIQHALRHRKASTRIGLAFFFFSFYDARRQTVSGMLRSLCLQLSSQCKDNYAVLEQLWKVNPHGTPPDESLLECLHQLFRSFDDVYIFLDALDESPDDERNARGEVMHTISRIRRWREDSLHLFVTSRNHPNIFEALEPTTTENVNMKNEEVNSDIDNFIATQLRERQRLRKLSAHHDLIMMALTNHAEGVFRLVACQLDMLEDSLSSARQLKKTLRSLPPTLSKTYDRILASIPESHTEHARRILTILCYAKATFSVRQVIYAAAVVIQTDSVFDPEDLLSEDDIYSICPSLIETEALDAIGEPLLRIGHFSVQEYLKSTEIGSWNSRAKFFKTDESAGNAEMAVLCLTLLLEIPPWIQHNERILEEDASGIRAILEYAARYWHQHYMAVGTVCHGQLTTRLAIKLFRTFAFSTWTFLDHRIGDCTHSQLYYASSLGLNAVVSDLLNDMSWCHTVKSQQRPHATELINFNDNKLGTALQAASEGGHVTTIQLLLDRGADVNTISGRFGTALQAAAYNGHTSAVEILSNRGADVNIIAGHYGNALQAAARHGSPAISKRLLDVGAHVNAFAGRFGTALQAASADGSEELVELLIDYGADVNAQGGLFGTALIAASCRKHEAIVKLLLSRGAQINAQNVGFVWGKPQTTWTDTMGSTDSTASLLDWNLDHGAYFNLHGQCFTTCLVAASYFGALGVVALLLANGADVHAHGGYHGTALQVAKSRGHSEVAKLLAENGASTASCQSVDALEAAFETTLT